MKNLFAFCFLFLVFLAGQAQVCNNGPFPGHNFQFSTPYTLANGNMGVALLYRNDNAVWNPIDLQGLVLSVRTNSCGNCGQISTAFATSFRNYATVTTATDHRSASFGWNGVPTGTHFPLVDNEVIMVLDFGSATCSPATCFDLSVSVSFMFANGGNVPQNQITTCDREICMPGQVNPACAATYMQPGFFPSPYAQPTLAASDDYLAGGRPTSAIQFWDPLHDPWKNLFVTPLCVTAVSFTIVVTGDLSIAGATSGTFPGATIIATGDRLTFTWSGTGQQIFSSDVFLLLRFLPNNGCGWLNFCNVSITTCQGDAPISVIGCSRRICLGVPGKQGMPDPLANRPEIRSNGVLNFPNPFHDRTEFRFSLPQAMPVTFKVFSTAGQQVHMQTIAGQEGMNALQFEPSQEVASGIYIYTVETSQGTFRGKFIRE